MMDAEVTVFDFVALIDSPIAVIAAFLQESRPDKQLGSHFVLPACLGH